MTPTPSTSSRHALAWLGLAAMLATLLTACSLTEGSGDSDGPEPIDFATLTRDTSLLYGSWAWQRTTLYFTVDGTPQTSTPATTSRTETLAITADDTVAVFVNDTLERREHLGVFLARAQWGVKGDTFAVSTAALDGPETVYTRAESP
jgi:hypothetical protein